MIDHTCHQMKNTSRGINFHSGVQHLDPSISVPQTWAENSNTNCQTSQGNLKIEKDIVKLQCKFLLGESCQSSATYGLWLKAES